VTVRAQPVVELDPRYGEEGVPPTEWAEAQRRLENAEFFDVYDATFHHGPGEAWVFEVAPVTAYGFGKGEYSHTRWRFE
jgi:hypothetical protein